MSQLQVLIKLAVHGKSSVVMSCHVHLTPGVAVSVGLTRSHTSLCVRCAAGWHPGCTLCGVIQCGILGHDGNLGYLVISVSVGLAMLE